MQFAVLFSLGFQLMLIPHLVCQERKPLELDQIIRKAKKSNKNLRTLKGTFQYLNRQNIPITTGRVSLRKDKYLDVALRRSETNRRTTFMYRTYFPSTTLYAVFRSPIFSHNKFKATWLYPKFGRANYDEISYFERSLFREKYLRTRTYQLLFANLFPEVLKNRRSPVQITGEQVNGTKYYRVQTEYNAHSIIGKAPKRPRRYQLNYYLNAGTGRFDRLLIRAIGLRTGSVSLQEISVSKWKTVKNAKIPALLRVANDRQLLTNVGQEYGPRIRWKKVSVNDGNDKPIRPWWLSKEQISKTPGIPLETPVRNVRGRLEKIRKKHRKKETPDNENRSTVPSLLLLTERHTKKDNLKQLKNVLNRIDGTEKPVPVAKLLKGFLDVRKENFGQAISHFHSISDNFLFGEHARGFVFWRKLREAKSAKEIKKVFENYFGKNGDLRDQPPGNMKLLDWARYGSDDGNNRSMSVLNRWSNTTESDVDRLHLARVFEEVKEAHGTANSLYMKLPPCSYLGEDITGHLHNVEKRAKQLAVIKKFMPFVMKPGHYLLLIQNTIGSDQELTTRAIQAFTRHVIFRGLSLGFVPISAEEAGKVLNLSMNQLIDQKRSKLLSDLVRAVSLLPQLVETIQPVVEDHPSIMIPILRRILRDKLRFAKRHRVRISPELTVPILQRLFEEGKILMVHGFSRAFVNHLKNLNPEIKERKKSTKITTKKFEEYMRDFREKVSRNRIIKTYTDKSFPKPEKTVKEKANTYIDWLDHNKLSKRKSAVRKLVEMGEPVVPLLKPKLTSGHPELRRRARQAVYRIALKASVRYTNGN